MATLILTTVGTAIGGPIGASLGALAGQAIDAKLFKPKGRDGPRLTELAVQTSSYGTAIPKLFGTIRVAGTVIWSTDLIEHVATEGGGKGRPSATNYTYSASFAVLVSARAVRSVGRIWAEGTLLRGAAGDFKIPVTFRFHPGGEAQPVDPLIASAEGIVLAPACRGQAYAVFENLPLADFGNRIPSLTFEVEADEGPVTCGAIATAISDGAIDGIEAVTPLDGYSAYGETIRGVAEGLVATSGAWIATDGDTLTLRVGGGAAIELADAGAGGGKRGVRSIAAADAAPRVVTLQHYDPARDYQAGVQRAARAGAGQREMRIELPAAIGADAAKTVAGAALARADLARERRTLSLDWRAIGVAPGDRVRIAGEPGLWRIADWSLESMVLTLDLVRVARAPVAVIASAGRLVASPDLPVGTTVLHAFEMPPIDDALPSAPRLTIAACGTGVGWRGAAVQLSLDDGARWTAIGATRGRATLGHLATAPAAASSMLVDRASDFDVILESTDMVLADADDAALDRGANLALVGDEMLQFGRAEPVAPGRWRLSGLWRGRRGTEWAVGGASFGDRFVLLDANSMVTVDLPAGAIGGTATVMASGAGDHLPVTATAAITGDSVAPPSPVHLQAVAGPDGTLHIGWTRRGRAGWHWIDRLDAPLSEDSERYVVEVGDGAGASVATAHITLPPGSWSAGDAVSVRQIGSHAPSRPAALILP